MITIEEFRKMELQIGEIVSAEPHPQADKLLILKVRLGESEKTLVSGIRLHYQETDLIGKKVAVVVNLAPAQIRGVTSEGMILAASDPPALTLLVPDREISSGAKVS